MPQESAGILMFRRRGGVLEVLLGHFGGPFWARRDAGAWAVPKGLIEPGESAEVAEELGTRVEGPLLPLGRIRQKGGKHVEAFAVEGELDPEAIVSNRFTAEWPPKSGRFESFPEIDRAGWFALAEARARILPSQMPLLDLLESALAQEKGGRS